MNNKKINNLHVIINFLIIFILGIVIVIFTSNSLLTINTLSAIKTDLFKSREENSEYYNYMNIFENYILAGDYMNAYSLLDDYNAKEKFNDITDFKQKMEYIYTDKKNYQYNIENIVEKEKYKDVYIKTYISYKDISNIQTGIVEFMIREYSAFDYKIYVRTEINI